ncbi:glycosyltransferase [Clostridium sp. ZBS12]|uniref:glycosyltransferase n=1 Tax=Clostridium sp. ZBS12 TaxID=2949972 RepID=UPI002079B100|nr:glycosyltransferase [Clostridium sp. ZBS12]
MAITFDQYQRYKTIEIIVKSVKEYYKIDKLNILEVGSNEQLNLEKFLPDENITYSDLEIPKNISNNSRFIIADATNLSDIRNNEYDIVVSSDVFEHIPDNKRKDFLNETSRVAKLVNINCFPFNSEAVESAEIRANEYYKTMFGIDHIWLKEHIDNGLPDINNVKRILEDSNKNYFMFEHGDVFLWEEITKALSFSEYIPELSPLMQRIEELYQQNIFKYDVGESNYRKFITITKDLNLNKHLESKLKNIFEEKIPQKYINSLYKNIQDMRFITQIPNFKNKIVEKESMTIYYDTGNGFDENSTLTHDYSINKNIGRIDLVINVPKDVMNFRFDPIEQKATILNNLTINSNVGILEYDIINGFSIDNYIIFNSNDPQILINCSEKSIEWLKIQTNIYALEYNTMIPILNKLEFFNKKLEESILLKNNLIEKEKSIEQLNNQFIYKEEDIKKLNYEIIKKEQKIVSLIDELDKYKLHYNAAMFQKNEINNRFRIIENEYNVVLNSTCWKITKPVRVILDLIKKILNSNRYTHLFYKGLKCLKQNGVKYTLNKMKQKSQNLKGYNEYSKKNILTDQQKQMQINTKFSRDIKFSIVVPLYNTPKNFLCEMIDSCIDQTYINWELCLADGSDKAHDYVGKVVKDYMKKDKRIKYKLLEKNLGISENTNESIKMATGDYIALFDHDDLLHPSALFEYMKIICEKDADFIYCDELTFEGTLDKVITMHFKPDFAIDNLRANNYICHFSVFKYDLLDKVGMFRKEFDGSQDHDMILRLTEKAEKIVHIPQILYFWRSHPNSVASDINSKTYAIDAGKRAVKEHLNRCGLDAVVESSEAFPTIYKFKYRLKNHPLISIIIPNKDNIELLSKCINSILEKSTYNNYEILIIENNSSDDRTFKYYDSLKEQQNINVINYESQEGFNYSAINNFAVNYAKGEHIVFLNNDIEIISENWIEEMLMYSQREDVGAVGAKLYYSNDTIQHAGVILKLGAHRCAGHCHYGCSKDNLGYMGRLYYAQNFSAVTAACLMMKKSILDEIGGFDESFKVAFNDIDLCMRIRKIGYLIVWTPYAEAYHYESISRGAEDTREKQNRFEDEVDKFKEIWNKELEAGDPYYNVNLTLDSSDFSLKELG